MEYERRIGALTPYERMMFDFALQRGYMSVAKCTRRHEIFRAWAQYTYETGRPYAVLHLGHHYADFTVVVRGPGIDAETRSRLDEMLARANLNFEIRGSDINISRIPRSSAHDVALEVLRILGAGDFRRAASKTNEVINGS